MRKINFFKNEKMVISLILVALLCIAFYDVVFLQKTFKASTAVSQSLIGGVYGQEDNKPKFIPINVKDPPLLEEPLFEFIKKNLKRGIVPLWNPHQGCGFPLIGMIQVGMFFPVHYIYYIFPQIIGWDLMILTRFFLAGLFVFWMMRSLRISKTPALGTAICFMLSGPMILMQTWTANVDILLPLVILSVDKLVRKPLKKHVALFAFFIFLTILGGHPEHIFIVHFIGFCFFLFRLFTERKNIACAKVFARTAGGYALGLSLSAFALLPFIYNFIFEFWHGHPAHAGLHMEEHMERIITIILPHFFQKEPLTYEFQFAGWWGGYLGTLPVALALVAMFRKQRKGINFFFGILTFLLISKAYSLPFINWIGYLPIFGMIRYAIHSTHAIAFGMSVCAGFGLRYLLTIKDSWKKLLAVNGLLAIVIAGHMFHFREATYSSLAFRAGIFSLSLLLSLQLAVFLHHKHFLQKKLSAILFLGLIFFELFSYIHRERPKRFNSFPTVPYMEFIKQYPERVRAYGLFWTFYPNTASAYELDDLGIFLGLLPKRFVDFITHVVSEKIFTPDDFRPPALRTTPLVNRVEVMDALNVRFLVSPTRKMYKNMLPLFESYTHNESLVYTNEVSVYEHFTSYPRAYVVHRVLFENDQKEMFEAVNRFRKVLRLKAIIQDEPDQFVINELQKAPYYDLSKAEIISYTPNRVELMADMESPGLLVLSDAYHPDWRATVDGKSVPIYFTNGLVRSVFVPKGQHRVIFTFQPPSFTIGLLLSGISFFLILLLLIRRKSA